MARQNQHSASIDPVSCPLVLPQTDCNLAEKSLFAKHWADYCRRGYVRNLFDLLLSEQSLLKNLAARSYRHENGFTKLLLLRLPALGYHIRLHLWQSDGQIEQNVHNHRFDFWSFVLNGKITNHIWEPVSAGQPFLHYRYDPRGEHSQYTMRRLTTTSLSHSGTRMIEKGESYYFDSRWLHTISCEEHTATLLLEDVRQLRDSADVYSPRLQDDDVTFYSPPLTALQYKQALLEALPYLSREL